MIRESVSKFGKFMGFLFIVQNCIDSFGQVAADSLHLGHFFNTGLLEILNAAKIPDQVTPTLWPNTRNTFKR